MRCVYHVTVALMLQSPRTTVARVVSRLCLCTSCCSCRSAHVCAHALQSVGSQRLVDVCGLSCWPRDVVRSMGEVFSE